MPASKQMLPRQYERDSCEMIIRGKRRMPRDREREKRTMSRTPVLTILRKHID